MIQEVTKSPHRMRLQSRPVEMTLSRLSICSVVLTHFSINSVWNSVMNYDKSNSTAVVVLVGANLPGHPLEMRSIGNDFKLDHSIEYNSMYLSPFTKYSQSVCA